MRRIISALIIDPLKQKHNYDNVKIDKLWENYEEGFEIKVIENTDHILEELNNMRGVDCIITIGDDINFEPLNNLSFQFRKKWIHKDEFKAKDIAYCIMAVFNGNINRETPPENKLFSIFTSTYNTNEKYLDRLYNSLLAQTYHDWNWFIIDDSRGDFGNTEKKLLSFKDPRITILKNVTNHGSIGFNKHMISMMCDGDYLVEVDHDDELMPNCLEKLKEAFDKFPDSDFVYSYCMEQLGEDESVYYGEEWGKNGWGGGYKTFNVKGLNYPIALTADITPVSIRTIFTQPNHVRCWKREFYHKINGHNCELSVLDDADILIRTFLNGKITKVEDLLYIQHESKSRNGGDGENTQSKRFKEIQRTSELLKNKYDDAIHERILSLGYNDCAWENNMQKSNLFGKFKDIPIMNHILK